jgi:hypothetical protein
LKRRFTIGIVFASAVGVVLFLCWLLRADALPTVRVTKIRHSGDPNDELVLVIENNTRKTFLVDGPVNFSVKTMERAPNGSWIEGWMAGHPYLEEDEFLDGKLGPGQRMNIFLGPSEAGCEMRYGVPMQQVLSVTAQRTKRFIRKLLPFLDSDRHELEAWSKVVRP